MPLRWVVDSCDTTSPDASTHLAVAGAFGAHGVGPVTTRGRAVPSLPFEARYELCETIGVGGMGEVFAARDLCLGRDVAVKFMRETMRGAQELRERFEREVRVQGQLEHPSIIPVYEFGSREDGSVYFVMKRVRGQTLREIMRSRPTGVGSYATSSYLRRLLRILVQCCQAIAYAHARGVVHRDLKPTNLIVGAFGEVYVLDWGIAKVLAPASEGDSEGPGLDLGRSNLGPSDTELGAVVGTPGYLSPEQVDGDSTLVGPASDIFSLGTILFEMATGQRLIEEASSDMAVARVLSLEDDEVEARLEEAGVHPQLAEICGRCLRKDVRSRYPRVEAIVEDLERFLAGEQEQKRKRETAANHVVTAMRALRGRERDNTSPSSDLTRRSLAIRELGAALATSPGDPEALRLLAEAITRPLDELPEPVRLSLRARSQRSLAQLFGSTGRVSILWGSGIVALAFLGSPHPVFLALSLAAALTMAILGWRMGRGDTGVTTGTSMTVYALGALIAILASFVMGPLIFVPTLAVYTAVVNSMAGYSRFHRRVGAGVALASFCGSILLHASGLVPASMRMGEGSIEILPVAIRFPSPWTEILMVLTHLGMIWGASYPIHRFAEEKWKQEERLASQSWLLEQLLPQSVVHTGDIEAVSS